LSTEAQEFFRDGLSLYRMGQHKAAATAFHLALASDKNAWEARLYLAMCLARCDQEREAMNEFLAIRDFCPDAELRKKAVAAFTAMLGKTASTNNC
jgi:Flp pilus assembly protein TadD